MTGSPSDRAKSDWARYKAEQRARRRAQGFVEVTVWAHPDDKEKIRRHARRLEVKRPAKESDEWNSPQS